jgi:hypothetical protein
MSTNKMKSIAERLAERRALKRRAKRLEKCLQEVTRSLRERGYELNGAGADTEENAEWVFLCHVVRRIRRTTQKEL